MNSQNPDGRPHHQPAEQDDDSSRLSEAVPQHHPTESHLFFSEYGIGRRQALDDWCQADNGYKAKQLLLLVKLTDRIGEKQCDQPQQHSAHHAHGPGCLEIVFFYRILFDNDGAANAEVR